MSSSKGSSMSMKKKDRKNRKNASPDEGTFIAGGTEDAPISDFPSLTPSDSPSMVPSDAPSAVPSDAPSVVPTSVLGAAGRGDKNMMSKMEMMKMMKMMKKMKPMQPKVRERGVGAEGSLFSDFPSIVPSDAPSVVPSDAPSVVPSDAPSVVPSDAPSLVPSDAPSLVPSDAPSAVPSGLPLGLAVVPGPLGGESSSYGGGPVTTIALTAGILVLGLFTSFLIRNKYRERARRLNMTGP